jgi:hypothetical protein
MSDYEPDFIERNGTWILSMIGVLGACMGGLCVYMIKSRCTKIKLCGMECERDVLALDPSEIQVAARPVIPTVR